MALRRQHLVSLLPQRRIPDINKHLGWKSFINLYSYCTDYETLIGLKVFSLLNFCLNSPINYSWFLQLRPHAKIHIKTVWLQYLQVWFTYTIVYIYTNIHVYSTSIKLIYRIFNSISCSYCKYEYGIQFLWKAPDTCK